MTRKKLTTVFVGFLFIGIPFALNLIPADNRFGFKTAKTLSSPVIMRQKNIFFGSVLVVGSLIALAIVFFRPDAAKNHGTRLLMSVPILALLFTLIYLNLLPG